MDAMLDLEAWRQVTLNSLSELAARVARFLPGMIGALLILLVGWIISKVIGAVATRALHRFGLDRAAERLELSGPLKRAGLGDRPSAIVGRLLYWILLLTFLVSAVETLGLTAVTSTIDRLIGYLPNVAAAGLMLVIGLLVGKLAGNLVSSGAAAANLVQASRVGAAVHGIVVLLVVVLVLEQLGVETELLVMTIAVLLAAAGFTMGIAFALGARPLVTHILAGHYLRQRLPRGQVVEVNGRRGEVERVGPIDTLLHDDESSWSIPNAALIDEILIH
jgi:hypothetical protein